MMRMLLLSNSGSPYLGYVGEAIDRHFAGTNLVGFVSAARLGGADAEAGYFDQAQKALERGPRKLVHLRWERDGLQRLDEVDAVFVGGGNTFALLQRLRQSGMLVRMAARVRVGMPYLGSSAGTNITGPTILTTNDWNVSGVSEFGGMSLFPWQINPHYFAAETGLPETACREPRIAEFHLMHETPVLAIEEQTGLEWDGREAKLFGLGRARLFRRRVEPCWINPGQSIACAD